MLPTLNPNARGQDSAKDKLLMRLLPRAEQGRTVFVDDVVAFNTPFAAGSDGVMVRRVTALEGEEMVSSDKDDEAFELPQGVPSRCSRCRSHALLHLFLPAVQPQLGLQQCTSYMLDLACPQVTVKAAPVKSAKRLTPCTARAHKLMHPQVNNPCQPSKEGGFLHLPSCG